MLSLFCACSLSSIYSFSPNKISGWASMLGVFSEKKPRGMEERGSSFETEVTCSAENTSAELSLCQLIDTSSLDQPTVTRPVAKAS